VERIVRRIGEAIGSGVLEPGERLPAELDLAAMLDVAPMTLRHALAVLREAGFVDTRRGRGGGTFVADDVMSRLSAAARAPSAEELRELTDWRRAVSGEAAALAASRATDGALAVIEQAAEAVDAAAGQPFSVFRLADSRFHLAVADASGSGRLVGAETAVQAELGEALAAIPAPELARRASATGHAPLVEALLRRDPLGARHAMERHVEATHDWIVGLRLGRLRG
jgi:GntR family transcriptional repressor for pyruvate dehydrogenase complex